MKRTLVRGMLAMALGLTLVVGGGLRVPISAPLQLSPAGVAAADASIGSCTEGGFDAALNTVQTSGGGTISFSCSGTIGFTSEKVITTAVTIIGNGNVIFDGGDSTRLFQVNTGASLELDDLTLQNGGGVADGGAIYNADGGTLTITDSTFSDNSATAGGAIYNSRGALAITFSTFIGNSANEGGAIYSVRARWRSRAARSSGTAQPPAAPQRPMAGRSITSLARWRSRPAPSVAIAHTATAERSTTLSAAGW